MRSRNESFKIKNMKLAREELHDIVDCIIDEWESVGYFESFYESGVIRLQIDIRTPKEHFVTEPIKEETVKKYKSEQKRQRKDIW